MLNTSAGLWPREPRRPCQTGLEDGASAEFTDVVCPAQRSPRPEMEAPLCGLLLVAPRLLGRGPEREEVLR